MCGFSQGLIIRLISVLNWTGTELANWNWAWQLFPWQIAECWVSRQGGLAEAEMLWETSFSYPVTLELRGGNRENSGEVTTCWIRQRQGKQARNCGNLKYQRPFILNITYNHQISGIRYVSVNKYQYWASNKIIRYLVSYIKCQKSSIWYRISGIVY